MNDRARDDASQLSGLSSLDSDTDEFGRMLIQQARDERRMQEALRGNIQPFRKARTHPRVRLTLENLERNSQQQTSPARHRYDSPESINGSDKSDPPVRPPRQWGSRARHDSSWLRRISGPVQDHSGEESDASYHQRTAPGDRTPRAADVPLPSVEDSPAILRRLVEGTPSSTKRYDASLQEWDLEEDLTLGSVLASTPAVPRNTRLDDIRQRELEGITNRRDRARGTSPEAASSRPLTAYQNNQSNANGLQLRERSDSERNLSKRPDRVRNKVAENAPSVDVGEAIPGSPVVVYRSPPNEAAADRGAEANPQTSPPGRPEQGRQDSHDLLRRLARATSNSPSPKRDSEGAISARRDSGVRKGSPLADRPTQQTQQLEKSKGPNTSNQTIALNAVPPMPTPPPEESDEATNDATGHKITRTSEDKQGIEVSTNAHDRKQSSTSNNEPPLAAKTPVVTGAWIETPAPDTARRSFAPSDTETPSRSRSTSRTRSSSRATVSRPSSSKNTEIEQKRTSQNNKLQKDAHSNGKEPTLPRSALAAVVKKAKLQRKGGHANETYGESTIDSLEDLVSPAAESTTDLDLDEDTLEALPIPPGRPKTPAERERQQELLQLQSMNARLRAARSSIRDANRNMRHLEHQVDAAEVRPMLKENSRGTCQQCQCAGCHSYVSPPRWFWEWIKGLYYDKNGKGRYTKLTWFGLISLIFWSWFWTETALCTIYCNPVYAERMEGFGVDPDAPERPYVTVTVLSWIPPFSWLKKVVLPLLGVLSWAFEGIYHALWDSEEIRTTTARRIVQPTMKAEWEYRMSDDQVV